LEELAWLAHDAFCHAKMDRRWSYNERRNDDPKVKHHNLLKDYSELRETDKERNRATVRWIPKKLEREGYAVALAGCGKRVELDDTAKENLAIFEHDIWMKGKLAAGYVWGPEVSESPKTSPYLVDWSVLDDEFKYVDYQMVEAIPRILAAAHRIIVKKK
ncbi:MAG: RyR domain-containing protein, partial [Thermoanaerobaculia bacterium]